MTQTSTGADRLFTPVFLLGFLYNFVISLHFTNNALYPLYIVQEGGDVAMVGLFMGVYAVAGVLARPLVGILLDRYGPRTVMIIGSLMLSLPALGYLLLLGSGLPAAVWLLRVVQGAGYGAHFSATFTLAASIAPEGRRTQAVALYGTSGLAGSMMGPFIGETLIAGPGLAWFFVAMASIGVTAALIISRITIPARHATRFPRPSDILALFRAPGMRPVLALAFLFGVVYTTPTAFLATLSVLRSILHFSLYFTAWGVAGILIRFVGGAWGDRVGLRRVLVPGFVLYAAGMLLIHLAHSLPMLIAAGAVAGAAHGITFPAVTSLGYSLAPRNMTGSSMAVITGMMDTGAAIITLGAAPIAQHLGADIVFPLASCAGVIALAILITSIIRNPTPILKDHRSGA